MKRNKYLVIGAGPTGANTARLLADGGGDVTLASRRGGRAEHPRIHAVAIDARDPDAVASLAAGAAVIFNCAMPAYDRWSEEFPALAGAVLSATLSSGASLLTVGNVYAYGELSAPFSEDLPLSPTTIKGRVRAQIWKNALESGANVCEVRASDFLGPAAASVFTLAVLPGVLRGEPVNVLGDLDAPHSFTYTRDVAATLLAASRYEGSWGRAWHVPSHTLTVRALCARFAELAGAPVPKLTRMSRPELERMAALDSITREVMEMAYLLDRPCVLDSSATERALGVRATALAVVLRETLSNEQA